MQRRAAHFENIVDFTTFSVIHIFLRYAFSEKVRITQIEAFSDKVDFNNNLQGAVWGLNKKKHVSHMSSTIFHLVKSDFRCDESFPVKTGSGPTEMVDPSFDAEYPTLPGLVKVPVP